MSTDNRDPAEHPTDEALFQSERAAVDHARTCDECRVRAVRLRTGAALVERVRKTSQPDLDWAKVDAMVAAAAEKTALDIREGRIRKPSPARGQAMLGTGLALAAGALLAWRINANSHAPQTSVAQASAQQTPVVAQHTLPAQHGHSGGEAPLPLPAAWSEARVLLASHDVEIERASGERSLLNARSTVRAGDRLRGRSSSSRALIAAAHGQRLDARGESEVRIRALDAGGSAAELVRGEARVDVAQGSAKLSLDVHEWRVVAKGGAFVAKVDGDSVRVVVLSGTIDASHRGGAPMSLVAGSEFVLDKHGQHTAQPIAQAQDNAIDDRALGLGEEGTSVELPALPDGAVIKLDGVSLSTQARVLRLARAVRLTAERGEERWSLDLDPARTVTGELAWTPGRAAIVASATEHGSQSHAGSSAPRMPHASAHRTVLTANTIAPEAAIGFRAVQRALGQRARHCFDTCERSSSCGDASGIAPVVDFDAEGRVGSVRMEGAGSAALNQCIEREVRAMRLPLLANERVNLGRFSR